MTPVAIASNGAVILNAAYALDVDDAVEMIEHVGPHAELFIGVVVPERDVAEVLRRLDDAAAEIVGVLGPKLTAPPCRTRRPSRQAGKSKKSRKGEP